MTDGTGTASPWPDERAVADEVPLELDVRTARQVLDDVPFWFHTYSLNRDAGLYTPGEARDHGYRVDSIPASFEGLSVLDVGAFDGFYSFLAERRGAARILAVDNEQYRSWVHARWHVELEGGEAFRTIHRHLDSKVEYRRMDALDVGSLDERFDFIFCYGILHRVVDPFGLLQVLASRLTDDGRILIETYGIADDAGAENGAIHVPRPGDVYPRDEFVYWQFSSGALENLSAFIEGCRFETHSTPTIIGHPRIIGFLKAPGRRPAG